MRIGIFGGTFDPPHFGHLIAAEEARDQLDLDTVLFVPAGSPPHKLGKAISPANHRLAMVELAIQSNPAFELSRVDAERGGPSYSVDMVRLLRAHYPEDTELFFILGMDSLDEIVTWYRPRLLIKLTRLAVVGRPAFDVDMAALEAAVPGIRERIHFVPMPLIGIVATDLRRRLKEGRTIRYQVPPEVEAYIHEHELYRATQEVS